MGTAQRYVPIAKKIGMEHYEIILDDLEFMFLKKDLEKIAKLQNYGFLIHEIAEHFKRDEYEILLAILHLHRKGKIKRKLRVI